MMTFVETIRANTLLRISQKSPQVPVHRGRLS